MDQVIRWLTGYSAQALAKVIAAGTDFETSSPRPPPRAGITGVVCGVRVETVEEETMREIRRLDKLICELTKGKAMEKILRG